MYEPEKELLEKYADVLINYALNGGEGLKRGEIVYLQVPDCAKDFYVALRNTIIKAGGHIIPRFMPEGISREVYELSSDEQLSFFPAKFIRGLVDEIDHVVAVIAETDKHQLEGIDSKKILLMQKAIKPYFDWRREKENRGELTWTLGLYGTQAMADEVDLSLEDYWGEIIKACYLDEEDPVTKWREIQAEVERVKAKLNELQIEKLHVKSENTDLIVGIGEKRQWMGGSGRNIPSFELFISPDWRQTNGYVYFNQPLYRYGNLIKGVRLEFKEGIVTKVEAEQGEQIIKDMVSVENANKIGEYSLTDGRLSRITKFMGETLYDENVGGEFGNTHIALGFAYKDSYPGDPSKVADEEWEKLGYNDSAIHTDIISTENRIVTAHLMDGSEKIIYQDGKFTL